MTYNSKAINRVFTRKVISDLLKGKRNDVFDYVVRNYVDNFEKKKNGELITDIYTYLKKERRNEYFYMNTLINKLLSGIHNVNTTTAFSQIRIGHSIADFVMINGEGRVYEIKSDLDNFERLSAQLFDYYRAFSKVSILVSIHELKKAEIALSKLGKIGEFVGIYVLSEKDTIFSKERSRNPLEFNNMLNHTNIFKLLRKSEYEEVILRYFGEFPKVEPVFHFKTYLEYFEKIPILDAQKLTFQELKKRNKITVEEFESVKYELKSVVYFSGLINKLPEINQLLLSEYRG